MRILSQEKVGKCTIKHIERDSINGESFRGNEEFVVHNEQDKAIYSSRWFSDALDYIHKNPKCK